MKQIARNFYFSLLPFFGFIISYGLLISWLSGPVILAPSLVGMSLLDAQLCLSGMNLYLKIFGQKEDSVLVPGTIIEQVPTARSTLKKNQVLYVIVSKAPEVPTVKNYQGADRISIEKELATAAIRYKIFYQPGINDGICLGQYPEVGVQLSNPILLLYIAQKKKRPVLMPNFLGKSLVIVQDFLSLWNIKYSMTADSDIHGLIIDQRPLPGTIIDMEKLHTVHLQSEPKKSV